MLQQYGGLLFDSLKQCAMSLKRSIQQLAIDDRINMIGGFTLSEAVRATHPGHTFACRMFPGKCLVQWLTYDRERGQRPCCKGRTLFFQDLHAFEHPCLVDNLIW